MEVSWVAGATERWWDELMYLWDKMSSQARVTI